MRAAVWVCSGINRAPVSVSTGLCHELAALARLSLTEEEAELFAPQFERILQYLQQLQAVDVEGAPEYVPPASGRPLRSDEPGATLERDALLAGAPASRDGQICVPKFKED